LYLSRESKYLVSSTHGCFEDVDEFLPNPCLFLFYVYTVYVSVRPTIQRIATAARRLLDKEGAEAVTMRRVAHAVGITPMAIYRHYRNRASLMNALADEGFEELAIRLTGNCFSGGIEERLEEMAEIYLDHALQNPRLFELMFLKPRQGARRYPRDFKSGRSPTANAMAEVVKEGIASGYFRDEDAWEIVFEMSALSHGLIMLYLGGRMAVPRTQFRALYRRSFRRYLHGIRK
jgi:AcrR family transcriptional regulator